MMRRRGRSGKNALGSSASTEKLTYQTLSEKRDQVAIDEGGSQPPYTGIAVHDCWTHYKYDEMAHAVSNVHLFRVLTGIAVRNAEHTWAEEMKYK